MWKASTARIALAHALDQRGHSVCSSDDIRSPRATPALPRHAMQARPWRASSYIACSVGGCRSGEDEQYLRRASDARYCIPTEGAATAPRFERLRASALDEHQQRGVPPIAQRGAALFA
jgi:hypothetical protein